MKNNLILIALALALSGCTPGSVASAISAISHGAQWLGTVLDVAEGGSGAFFARHPNREVQEKIAAANRLTRSQLAVVEGLIAAGKAADDGELAAARELLIKAYEAERRLLEEAGVLDARAPAGGADAEAPEPQPFSLPTAAEVGARL